MDPERYLQETEHAVKHLFKGLEFYAGILKSINPPIFVATVPLNNDEESTPETRKEWWTRHVKQIKLSWAREREYLGYTVSQASLCGSILQIASMGLQEFSRNVSIPESCREIVEKTKAKYCIGRTIRGSPIGLIIYAGRIQYNHWNESVTNKSLINKTAQKVFDKIATIEECPGIKDPAFDLRNDALDMYTHNILALLGWRSYETYLKDMRALLLQRP